MPEFELEACQPLTLTDWERVSGVTLQPGRYPVERVTVERHGRPVKWLVLVDSMVGAAEGYLRLCPEVTVHPLRVGRGSNLFSATEPGSTEG